MTDLLYGIWVWIFAPIGFGFTLILFFNAVLGRIAERDRQRTRVHGRRPR